LPIELISFKASITNNNTKLTWQTASEKDNSHFAIERSQNGESFSKMGEVKGSGTTITTQNYQFTDATPYKGINYYRLRQVDFDGTESVSKTVSVNFDGKGQNKFKVYPTLVQDNLTVEVEGDAKSEITVRDLTGRVILTKNTEGPSAQVLNISGLSNGLYLLSVRTNDGFETIKITKQ
jgi:Secretion system C-terminal sorting domain